MIELHKLTTSKAAIKAKAIEFVKNMADAGNENPLSAYIQIRCIEELITNAKEALKEAAFDELCKYGKCTEIAGAKIERRNGGAVYSYDHDSTWRELQEAATAIHEQLKAREAFLRTVPSQGIADIATGELITPAILTTHRQDTITITLPR